MADPMVPLLELDAEEMEPIRLTLLVLTLGGLERYFGSAFAHNCTYDRPELNTRDLASRLGVALKTDALLSGQWDQSLKDDVDIITS
jgi:hypothetical protein